MSIEMDLGRFTFKVLGKEIGTASGWDKLDEPEFMFYDVELNEVGQRWVPGFEKGRDISINFESGEVTTYSSKSVDLDEAIADADDGNPVKHQPDWSVFNAC